MEVVLNLLAQTAGRATSLRTLERAIGADARVAIRKRDEAGMARWIICVYNGMTALYEIE